MAQISVLIPSYNHENYIYDTIRCVLDQTFSDIEVIIVDDGSTDDSNKIIASIKDSRIKHIALKKNVGACEAMNIGIEHCHSEFIAVCNSDDMWEKNKLEKQLAVLKKMPDVGAVFSNVTWVNESGEPLTHEDIPFIYNVFIQQNRSRYRWMKDLIEKGNCLCHPSVLIRSEVYKKVGNYNNYLRQLPDLHMWIRLLRHYNVYVMQDKLLKFRIHPNNTSKQDEVSKMRTWNESKLIIKDFFNDLTAEEFYNIFGFLELNNVKKADIENQFFKEKFLYLIKAENYFSAVYKELAMELLFYKSNKETVDIINALEFQSLTVGPIQKENIVQSDSANGGQKKKKVRILRYILGSYVYDNLRDLNNKRLQKRRSRRRA